MTRTAFAGLALLAALAPLAACKQVHLVPRDAVHAERFVFIGLDANSAIHSVSPIYEADSEEQYTLDLKDGLREVYALGVSDTQLAELDARYLPERADLLAISAVAPPAPPAIVFRGDDTLLRAAIPGSAPIFDARENTEASAGARATIEAGLTLELPIDLELCGRVHPMSLEPFGATAELLADPPPKLRDPKYRETIRVTGGDDRALLLTPAALYSVGRGEAIDPRPVIDGSDPFVAAKSIAAESLGPGVTFRSIAAFPRKPEDIEPRFLLAGDQNGDAAIWRLALNDQGVRVLERATFPDGPPRDLIRDIMIDSQGIPVAVGERGLVLTSEVNMSWIRARTPTGAEGEIRRAAASYIFTQPHAMATDAGGLYLGYAWQGYWDKATLAERANAIAAAIDGDELWTAGDHGSLTRRKDAMFAPIELTYPPSLAPCGEREAGSNRVLLEDTLEGAAIDEAFVYLQPRRCTAMVRVERSNLCVSPIELGGEVAIASTERTAVGAWRDTVVIAGANGLLLRVVR